MVVRQPLPIILAPYPAELNGGTPDHSSLTVIRQRLGSEVYAIPARFRPIAPSCAGKLNQIILREGLYGPPGICCDCSRVTHC